MTGQGCRAIQGLTFSDSDQGGKGVTSSSPLCRDPHVGSRIVGV